MPDVALADIGKLPGKRPGGGGGGRKSQTDCSISSNLPLPRELSKFTAAGFKKGRCVGWAPEFVTVVTMTDEFEFGPKMRALTERQRAFVMVLTEFPATSGAEAARMAGYSDAGEGCKVRACEMMHDQKIIEALQEQAGKRLWAISMKAAWRLEQMLDSKDDAVALKATGMVLDRTGHAAAQNININQMVTDNSGKAIMERIQALAAKHGLDSRALLGKPVVDAEFTEVKSG